MNNPTNQDQVKKKIDTFSFTSGEKMIFYSWKNKYQPTEDYQNLFNSPWCPLFGVLPFNDPPASTGKSLITRLRTYCGIPSHHLCPEAYPDPKVIFKLTGFPQIKLSLARTLFKKYIDDEEFSEDDIKNNELVNIEPLIRIASVWKILRTYYEHLPTPTQSEGKIVQKYLLKISRQISEKGEEYVERRKEIEVEEERLNARQKSLAFQTARIDRSREGKLKAKEIRKEKVKKSFYKLFKEQNVNFLTKNRIANVIHGDLEQNGEIISLNTVKSYLEELRAGKVISLPQKEISTNI